MIFGVWYVRTFMDGEVFIRFKRRRVFIVKELFDYRIDNLWLYFVKLDLKIERDLLLNFKVVIYFLVLDRMIKNYRCFFREGKN